MAQRIASSRLRMSDSDPDEVLMLQVARGDQAACRELVERHLDRILAFASRTVGDRAAAEDIAQEVFTRLWMHAKRWRPGPARLTTWLHRIAFNLCVDHAKRRRGETLVDMPDSLDSTHDAARLVAARDLQQHVTAALQSLPDTQRAAITLCHYQGFRNAEAAEVLGLSVEALESLLARGRRTLRQRLQAVAPDLLGED
jgi:RNA polymerase sigma-70 factor (ECF subfamily)